MMETGYQWRFNMLNYLKLNMTNGKRFRSKREKEWVDCDWLSINAFRETKYMVFFFFFFWRNITVVPLFKRKH